MLWFDLMFDVQALRTRGDLPAPVLASISAYYARVTTGAFPMNRLVALVMVATVGVTIAQAVGDDAPDWAAWASLGLLVVAIGIAGARTVPSARRLGTGRDDPAVQSELARSILRDHLVCLAAIAAVIVLQLGWAR